MTSPQLTRRTLLTALALAGAGVAVPGLAGCSAGRLDLAKVDVNRQRPDAVPAADVLAALSTFSGVLMNRLTRAENLICSPLSIWVALAMTRNGAAGATAAEMDAALHYPETAALNQGLNTLLQQLDKRAGQRALGDRKGEVGLDIADQVWGEQSEPWQQPFLTALARYYGTGVAKADFIHFPGAVTGKINAWVSDATHDKITDIVPPGVVTTLTRMVLANAIYLKAPWQQEFDDAKPGAFHSPSGTVQTKMMMQTYDGFAGSGPGWKAAQVPYLGGELAMTVILPDAGSEQRVHDQLGSGLISGVLGTLRDHVGINLTMPRFSFSTRTELTPVLQGLGMTSAFTDLADFSAMTTQDPLSISAVLHQGFIAVDEQGTEATGATVVVVTESSAREPDETLTLTLDRPFWFLIHDVATRAPLLVGQVADPSS